MTGLLELAERLEAATGPDRALDADIALSQGWEKRHIVFHSFFKGRFVMDEWVPPSKNLRELESEPPDYTSTAEARTLNAAYLRKMATQQEMP